VKNVTGLTKFLYLNFRTFQIPNGDIEEFDVQTAKNYWTNLISPNGGGKSLTVKQDSRMFQGAFEKGYTNYKPRRASLTGLLSKAY